MNYFEDRDGRIRCGDCGLVVTGSRIAHDGACRLRWLVKESKDDLCEGSPDRSPNAADKKADELVSPASGRRENGSEHSASGSDGNFSKPARTGEVPASYYGRDAEKRKVYMRDYMRKRREK